MDLEHYRKLLIVRERELAEESAHFDAEARDSRASEVEDPIDAVTSDEGKAANFRLGDMAARNLRQVRAALRRIDEGTYGYCVDCGRAIDKARLEVVPWALYCREHQQKHELAGPVIADVENA